MKKSWLSILLAAFLAVISGCADTGTDNGTGTGGETGTGGGNYDLSAIPVDENVFNFTKNQYGQVQTSINIKNPRTDSTKTYYPILISSAMGLNGEADLSRYDMGIIKGVGYRSYFGDTNIYYGNEDVASNLNFPDYSSKMYDLTSAKSLNASATGTYYIFFDKWNADVTPTGILIFAFLTKEEAAKYIPDNSNIKFLPKNPTGAAGFKPTYLDSKIVDELNKLGALKQYTFTVK